jgi:hypothetical protein
MSLLFVNTEKFVYFDKNTGNIDSIKSSKIDNNENYIKVPLNQIENLMTGRESIGDYMIFFNSKIREYKLIKKKDEEDLSFNINNKFYCICNKDFDDVDDIDIKIVQDNINKVWTVYFSDTLKESIEGQPHDFQSNLIFCVSQNNDPHQICQILRIKIVDLIMNESKSIPFVNNLEMNQSFSIFTIKKFYSYIYEIKNE